jgi:hypothetical protein
VYKNIISRDCPFIHFNGVDLRGFLGCFVQFQGSLGVLLLFSAGCFLNWWQLAGTTVSLSNRKKIRVNKEVVTAGKPGLIFRDGVSYWHGS